jgi:hypothetical protein
MGNTNAVTAAPSGVPPEATQPSIPPGSSTMNSKISISIFSSKKDADLVVASGRVVTSMTGNPDYPSPKPSLDKVEAARDAYVAAVDALDRGKLSIARRDKAREPMVQLLRELALYVQQASGGDREKLLGSGYPVQKTRQPAGVPNPPQNLRLRPAKISGQMLARCDRLAAAKSYQWRYASAAAPTTWIQVDPTTTASSTFENLVPGTIYTVQVRAVSSKGVSDWSDVATLMAA